MSAEQWEAIDAKIDRFGIEEHIARLAVSEIEIAEDEDDYEEV